MSNSKRDAPLYIGGIAWTTAEIAKVIELTAQFKTHGEISEALNKTNENTNKKKKNSVDTLVKALNIQGLYKYFWGDVEKPESGNGRNINDIIGRISELRVTAKLLTLGYDVFDPQAPGTYCDLLITRPGSQKLARIEVKTASRVNDQPSGESFRYSSRFNSKKIKEPDDFTKFADFYIIALYDLPNHFYVIPTSKLAEEAQKKLDEKNNKLEESKESQSESDNSDNNVQDELSESDNSDNNVQDELDEMVTTDEKKHRSLTALTLFPFKKKSREKNKWISDYFNNFQLLEDFFENKTEKRPEFENKTEKRPEDNASMQNDVV